ncbi:uncharacterized protein V6R79_019983 [Siganus canaliculatus]
MRLWLYVDEVSPLSLHCCSTVCGRRRVVAPLQDTHSDTHTATHRHLNVCVTFGAELHCSTLEPVFSGITAIYSQRIRECFTSCTDPLMNPAPALCLEVSFWVNQVLVTDVDPE